MKEDSIFTIVRSSFDSKAARSKGLLALSCLSIGIVLLAWWSLTASSRGKPPLVTPLKLPSPSMVVHSALFLGPTFLQYSLITFLRVLVGLILGSTIGVLIGLVLSASRPLDAIFSPILGAIRPVPVVALTPWVILWMGLGEGPQIFMVSLGAVMVMATSTYSLAANVDRRYIQASQSMGVDPVFIQTGIILPLIFPSVFAAMRVAAAICFGIAVAAEYLGAQGGLGFMIRNARTTLNTESILLGIFAIGLEAWLIDWGLRFWARKYSVWQNTITSQSQS